MLVFSYQSKSRLIALHILACIALLDSINNQCSNDIQACSSILFPTFKRFKIAPGTLKQSLNLQNSATNLLRLQHYTNLYNFFHCCLFSILFPSYLFSFFFFSLLSCVRMLSLLFHLLLYLTLHSLALASMTKKDAHNEMKSNQIEKNKERKH